MITASCPQCAAKLKVKVALAGKKVRCPRCKASVSIPDDATQASGPLADGGSAHVPAKERLTSASTLDVENEIARGGMGAIMRAIDHDIHREVAVKFLLNKADDRQKARFVEEAQITGQLEHPNIVPIHQLGVNDDGRCFFSMKMVKGRSLADILKDEKNPLTLGRLLSILVSVCNALAYAHSRHVIHRDLKPANIMIGDFGEVYVMDWGLAKVLGPRDAAASKTAPSTHIQRKIPSGDTSQIATAGDSLSSSGSGSGERVTTHRQVEGELTQAGAVMGTPAYMPPEQATGDHERVDERSDIYSLGALLYEIMTRTTPVGRGGDMVAILMRVAEGAIVPPAIRAPDRAKAGWVPPDLSAIAMKALAKDQARRYQSVEEFKRDIELYLEGRSVSAKKDTLRERAVKLVKRNKGVSIATAAASVVLFVVGVWSLIAILSANARARAEEAEKLAQAKRSLPSLVRAARLTINEREFDDALGQLDMALNIEDTSAEARLLKGYVLLAQQKFPEARVELEKYRQLAPGKAVVQGLLDLTDKARPDDIGTLLTLSDELNRQKVFAVAAHFSEMAAKLRAPREKLLEHHRRQLDTHWPGMGQFLSLTEKNEILLNLAYRDMGDLTPLAGMPIDILSLRDWAKLRDLTPLKGMPLKSLDLVGCSNVVELSPLRGMPLVSLDLVATKVTNLEPLAESPVSSLNLAVTPVANLGPLRGMPLTSLNLHNTSVTNLGPLQGLKLESLSCDGCNISDLSALKGMPLRALGLHRTPVVDLGPLRGMQIAYLNISSCPTITNFDPLKGMPLVELIANHNSPIDLSVLAGMPLKKLTATGDASITDLSPLKGMPLESLSLVQCFNLTDVTALKDMPLKDLNLQVSSVSDLTPLRGAPIQTLYLERCPKLRDLSPLKGMPLTTLALAHCTDLSDLTPLRGAPIQSLDLTQCPKLRDLSPLKGMPLTRLFLSQCIELGDVTPLKGSPLTVLDLAECKNLHDVTPLAGMKITNLNLPPDVTSGMEGIRNMKALVSIHGLAPEQFWKKWDESKGNGK